MKQIIFAFIAAFTVLSCTKDKDETDLTGSSSTTLLTQLDFTYPNDETYTKQYFYEETNKLSEIIDSNGNKEHYTYDGDLITKIEYEFTDPDYTDERFFTYDNDGRLIEEIFLYNYSSTGTKTVFTYQSDNTVDYIMYSGNLSSQTNLSSHGTFSLNSNGDILSNEDYSDTNNSIYRLLTYDYDNKNSPYLNIKDGSKDFNYVLIGGKNNVKAYSMFVSGTAAYNYTSTFEYNNDDFPTKELKLDSSGTTTINFTYN